MSTESFVRLTGVMQRTGLKRAHLYQEIRKGRFPRPLKIGARASAWRASEVDEWIAARIAATDAAR